MKKTRIYARDEVNNSDKISYDELVRLARLTPEEQEVCDMHYNYDISLYVIAINLHCSASRIYKLHSRILDKFAKVLLNHRNIKNS